MKESIRYITHEEQESFEKAVKKYNIKEYSFATFIMRHKSEEKSKGNKKRKLKAKKPSRRR